MKKILYIFSVLYLAVSANAFDYSDYTGNFSDRSMIMRSIEGRDKMNQQDRDILSEKKLTPTTSCLFEQIKKNDYDNVKTLLEAKLNPNISYLSDYPIYYASRLNRTEIVYLLYEYGAKLDKGFYSELYEAVRNKNNELAQFLIDKNAKINYTDAVTNNTILSMALKNNMYEIARQLIEKGAYADNRSIHIIKKKKLMYLIPDNKK